MSSLFLGWMAAGAFDLNGSEGTGRPGIVDKLPTGKLLSLRFRLYYCKLPNKRGSFLDQESRLQPWAGRAVEWFTEEYVQAVLESAGRTMMVQPNDGCWPARIRSCWPDAPDDEWFAYDANDPKAPKIKATMEQVTEMYMVLDRWIPLIEIPYYRRTVVYRMLRYPDTDRPVYSWRKLARKLNKSRQTVMTWHKDAIRYLTDRLNQCA